MSLEVLPCKVGIVGECPVCKTPTDSSLDFVKCSGKCENVLHFSCPLITEDIDPASLTEKTWTCDECTEILPISRGDSSEPKTVDAPPSPVEELRVPLHKTCHVCIDFVKNPFDALTCYSCKEVFHYLCVGYSSEKEFDEVLEDTKLKWKCAICLEKDSVCGSCKESAAENPFDILRCCKCQQVYHYACQGFTLQKFDQLLEEEKTRILCRTCTV